MKHPKTKRRCPGGHFKTVTEQIIGHAEVRHVTERYRTTRGYKRQESIRNVSRLIGRVRMKGADYNLGELVAQ